MATVPPWRWRDLEARAPLVPAAIGLMTGIVVDSVTACPPAVYVIASAACLALLLLPTIRRHYGLAVATVLAAVVGGLLHHNAYWRVSSDHIVHRTAVDSPIMARVTGLVLTDPRLSVRRDWAFAPWMYATDSTSFLLDADKMETGGRTLPVSGRVRVTVKEAVMDVQAGDRVGLFGQVYRPPTPDNPGQFDWARWNRRHGVLVGMSCDNRESVQMLESTGAGRWHRWQAQWRQRARGLLLDEMLTTDNPAGGLFEAMVLAQRTAVDPSINEAFVRIGCAHYLAASGFNVGMLALFLFGLGRAAGFSRPRLAVFVVAATVFYAVLAEPRPPILRAAVVGVAICLGLMRRRRASGVNLLAASALVLLVWRPTDLFDPGFQMSYACVAGLLLLPRLFQGVIGSIVRRRDDDLLFLKTTAGTGAEAWRSRLRSAAHAVFVRPTIFSLAACLPSWPIVLLVFQRFSPWAWLNTLLLTPGVALVMFAGFATLLAALVSPWLASLLTPVLSLATFLLLWPVDLLGRVPGVDLYVPTAPPLVWVVAYYAVLLAWLGWHRRAWPWPAGAVATALLALATTVWLRPHTGTGDLTMTVLSVGRGTSIVVELPDGRAMLYDAGCSGPYDAGATAIAPFLAHRGIGRLTTAVVSHPNLDHFGGLLSVVDRVPTDAVMMNPQFEALSTETKPSRRLLDGLRDRGIPIHLIDSSSGRFDFGSAMAEVLWPPPAPPFEPDANESSLVVRLTCHGRRILLTGDIGERAQGWLLASGIDLRADVLLLPHHGGMDPNLAAFVDAVAPQYLIQSSNRRTGPSLDALGAIVNDRVLFKTADDGAVTVVLGADRVDVSGFRRTAASAASLAGSRG